MCLIFQIFTVLSYFLLPISLVDTKTTYQSCIQVRCHVTLLGEAEEMAFMYTQWMFRGCSHSLIGVHVHSMVVQGVFNTHSLAFMCTHKCSGGVQYVFSLVVCLKAQWICFQICKACKRPYKLALNFCLNAISLALPSKKTWRHTSWLIGGLGVHQWDWQQKIRK